MSSLILIKSKLLFVIYFFVASSSITCQRNKVILEEIKSLLKVLNESSFKFEECKNLNSLNLIESKINSIETKFDQILDSIEVNKKNNYMFQSKVDKIENEMQTFKKDVYWKQILEKINQLDESFSLIQKNQDLHLKKIMNVISRIYETNEQIKEFIFTEKESEPNLETSLRKVLTESLSIAGYTSRSAMYNNSPKNFFNFTRLEKAIEMFEKIESMAVNTCDFLKETNYDRSLGEKFSCERIENRIEFANQELIDKIETEFRKIKEKIKTGLVRDEDTPIIKPIIKSFMASNDPEIKICNKIEPKQSQYQSSEQSQPKSLINPSNCNQLYKSDFEDGTYIIFPQNNRAFRVYCNMEPDGGWTVIMRRGTFKGSKKKYHISFNNTWNSYKSGFGDVEDEFWLGNDNIHSLTSQEENELKVDIEFFNGSCKTYYFDSFKLENEKSNYRIKIGNSFNGHGANYFLHHDNLEFSTHDRFNGYNKQNCAKVHSGGWWFQNVICYDVFLTGIYKDADDKQNELHSIFWPSWQPLKTVQMKIKPKEKRIQ